MENRHKDFSVPALFGIIFVVFLVMVFGRTAVLYVRETHTTMQMRKKIASLQDTIDHQDARYDSLMHIRRLTHPDVIWMARVIYSESDRALEQELVAWVIRNRYEIGYWGADTYKEVALQHKQFSAFNSNRPLRFYYATRSWYDQFENTERAARWKRSLEIAADVRFADPSERPFPIYTLYFYSEVSMPPWKKHPAWASHYERVPNQQLPERFRDIPEERFRFFQDPSCFRCEGHKINVAVSSE